MTDAAFDYESLDPGIRYVVKYLHQHGFVTTDSGDGSKYGEMECAIEIPMVAVVVDKKDLAATADRIADLLEREGFSFNGDIDDLYIECHYVPYSSDDDGIVLILGKSLWGLNEMMSDS